MHSKRRGYTYLATMIRSIYKWQLILISLTVHFPTQVVGIWLGTISNQTPWKSAIDMTWLMKTWKIRYVTVLKKSLLDLLISLNWIEISLQKTRDFSWGKCLGRKHHGGGTISTSFRLETIMCVILLCLSSFWYNSLEKRSLYFKLLKTVKI